MKPRKQIVISLLTAAALLGLAGCGKPAEKPKETEKQDVPAAAAPRTYPKEVMLDAMLRGHPNAKKVCIDEGRVNGFFLDYTQREPKEKEDVGIFTKNWLLIERIEFFEASNKSLFITDQDYAKYIVVYPDVDGLTCKER